VTGDSGIVTADSGMPPKIGHVRPESPVTMNRNDRSRSSGIVGHVEPEYPHDQLTRGNYLGRPAKMIVGKPDILLDAIQRKGRFESGSFWRGSKSADFG
jgi:hypothetical protein